jgi:hypothetical protein
MCVQPPLALENAARARARRTDLEQLQLLRRHRLRVRLQVAFGAVKVLAHARHARVFTHRRRPRHDAAAPGELGHLDGAAHRAGRAGERGAEGAVQAVLL